MQQQKRLTLCSCRCLVAGPWDGKRPDGPDGASRKEESSLSVDSDSEESSLSEDAELSPDHAKALPLVAWARVCRRLRSILGRGQGNFHLENAYRRCRITGRPKICIPGNTRMIVYSTARATTRRRRGCWGKRVANASGQARLARTSQKPVPRRRARSMLSQKPVPRRMTSAAAARFGWRGE